MTTTKPTTDLVTLGSGRATHVPGHQTHTTLCWAWSYSAKGHRRTRPAGHGVPTCKTCLRIIGAAHVVEPVEVDVEPVEVHAEPVEVHAEPVSAATVERQFAPSGNRDADYFQPKCAKCGWEGAPYSNRTIEGRQLAERDADAHRCRGRGSRTTSTVENATGAEPAEALYRVVRQDVETGRRVLLTTDRHAIATDAANRYAIERAGARRGNLDDGLGGDVRYWENGTVVAVWWVESRVDGEWDTYAPGWARKIAQRRRDAEERAYAHLDL